MRIGANTKWWPIGKYYFEKEIRVISYLFDFAQCKTKFGTDTKKSA